MIFFLLSVALAAAPQTDKVFTTKAKPKSVMLIVHGLNLLPEKMDRLASLLADSGIETHRVALPGHRLQDGELTTISARAMEGATAIALVKAKARADSQHVPLELLGYSVGAPLGLLAAEQTQVTYSRQIFFAPAFEPRPITKIVKLLFPFGARFNIPSFNHEGYRAHDAIPPLMYEALFDVIDAAAELKLPNVPTTVFLDPDDELVSEPRTRELIQKQNLTNWQVADVHSKSTLSKTVHHIFIDEATAGDAAFGLISKQIGIIGGTR